MGVRLAFLLFCFLGSLQISTSSPASAKEETEAIILGGGWYAKTSVEVFVPSTGKSCSLPSLPDERSYNTMDGTTICGGYGTPNCLSFSSGKWVISNTLVEARSSHSSWKTDQGILLMGGENSASGYSSEMVPKDGGQAVPAFDMKKNIKWACAIQDLTSASFILTGGNHSPAVVTRYDLQGFVEDLPDLIQARYGHGCGSFLREDGTQVYLVAGGYNNNFPAASLESSTEMLTTGSTAWTMAAPLPEAMWALRGVTASNVVYMAGGYGGTERDQILAWMDDEQEWKEVGKLKTTRAQFGLTTIKLDDPAMEFCV